MTSSREGFGGIRPVSRYSVIRLKIQGFPLAPLATITPSQPVSASIRLAASGESTSPFPITGMETASFTWRMISQSAFPE